MESRMDNPLDPCHISKSKKKRKRNEKEVFDKPKSKKAKIHEQVSILRSDSTEELSPFHIQTSSLYLPLSSVSQMYPVEGMCAEHLSPLLLTYYPPFNGLVLSYSDPVLSESPFENDGDNVLLKNIDEYAASWGWLTADFLILKPQKGTCLEGVVTLQNDGFLAVVCWNLFNASIERGRLPHDWKWKNTGALRGCEDGVKDEVIEDDGAGYYIDGNGKKVEGMVKFRVADIESSQDRERGFLTIVGTMLDEKEERTYVENLNLENRFDRKSGWRRLGGPNAIGATNLGYGSQKNQS